MKKPDDISSGLKTPMVRGKWANLLEKGSNVAVLDLDIVDHFPDSASVNRALRAYLRMKQEFMVLEEHPEKLTGERKSPLPFDPRNGRRSEPVAATK